MSEKLQTMATTQAIKGSDEIVSWDGYQKEVSVKKQIVIKPAYADKMKEVTASTPDGTRAARCPTHLYPRDSSHTHTYVS